MDKMKKFLLCTILVVCCFLIAAASLAEGEIGIGIEVADVAEDGKTTVALDLTSCLGMDSLQFNLNYDSTAFQYVTAEGGELLSDGLFVFNPDEPGVVRFAFACADGLKNDSGTAFTVILAPTNEFGSVLTITDVLATKYDSSTQEQTKAYITLQNNEEIIGEGSPEARITPWIPETPTPAPTFTPEPTATAEPTVVPENETTETDIPEEPVKQDFRKYLPYVAIGLVVIIIVLIIVLIIRKKRDED